jgi:3-oxoacyl-[acyl-carrier-protein] synthase II
MAASLPALSAAALQLQNNSEIKAIVVVAADEVCSTNLRMLEALGCLAPANSHAWSPYVAQSPGMIVGEGAVALVLERASDARARGRQPLAAIASVAQSFDATDIGTAGIRTDWWQAEATGQWLSLTIENALRAAHCNADDIAMIIGNGCGVPQYDARELFALRHVFGNTVVPETVNRNVGVLESACGLLAVAAAASHVGQASAKTNSVTTATRTTAAAVLSEPTAVLVCASSETGRNTCAVVRAAE